MSRLRVLVLWNDDGALAHGSGQDRAAVAAVRGAVDGVLGAGRQLGWRVTDAPAPDDPAALLALLRRRRPDVVVNFIESVGGEARLEAAAAGLLELAGVPYTGSPPAAMTLALHKPVARAVLAAAGVAVPRGAVLLRGDEPLSGLRPPLIVKPSREDASHGIETASVVSSGSAARRRARFILRRYRQPALVEEFVRGREFNVSILGTGDDARVLPLAEIDYSAFPRGRPRLVTYAAKWDEDSAEFRGSVPVAPQKLSAPARRRIESGALAAYRALGLADYGRVDLRLDARGRPLVLDVNANPDLSPGAGLARAAERAGLPYADLIARIVGFSLDHA